MTYVKNPNGGLKTTNSSRLTVDPEGNLWFSNVTRKDASNDFFYACSAASYFRSEYKVGNRVVLQVNTPLVLSKVLYVYYVSYILIPYSVLRPIFIFHSGAYKGFSQVGVGVIFL